MKGFLFALLLLPTLLFAGSAYNYYQNTAPNWWVELVDGQSSSVFWDTWSNPIKTPSYYINPEDPDGATFQIRVPVPSAGKLGMLLHIDDNVARVNHAIWVEHNGVPKRFVRTDGRGLLTPVGDSTQVYTWGADDPLEFAWKIDPTEKGFYTVYIQQLYPTNKKVVKTLRYTRGATRYTAYMYLPKPQFRCDFFVR